ncbi:uncharacterized protein [Ptychodera flava]|uniref:uncharacterized protein n=1 Tax=Ptychodera flava TaxID=63121 RepID=UPI00396A7967
MALVILKTWEVEEESSTAKPTSSIIRDFRERDLDGDQDTEIHCAILDVKVTEEQKRDAENVGVKLIPVTMEKMLNPNADLPGENCFLFHEHYYPQLKHLQDLQHVAGYLFNGKNTAAAIHESFFPEAKLHQLDIPEAQPGALFVNDDWDENDCGLTGFHRTLVQDFCARKAKDGKAVKAYSTVLDVKISKEKKIDAKNCGVTLIPAVRKEGTEPEEDQPELKWLLNHEIYFPDLKKLKNIKHVIGYAPKTARAAADILEQLFKDADLVMINHAYNDHNCLWDVNRERLDEKMLKMASKADIIFSIGPKMHEYFRNQYRANVDERELAKIPHAQLFPKPRSSFFLKDPYPPLETNTRRILTYGQLNTHKSLKPCEELASSISNVIGKIEVSNVNALDWQILGVPAKGNHIKIIRSIENKLKSKNMKPQFSSHYSAKTLLTRLHQSDLCLPASCFTDYGFCGMEAMATAKPTFAFENTDLGQLMKKHIPMEADKCVVRNDTELSDKIINAVDDMNLAFGKAKIVKKALIECIVHDKSYSRFAGLLTPKKKTTGQISEPRNMNTRNSEDCQSDTIISIHVKLDEDVYRQYLQQNADSTSHQRRDTVLKSCEKCMKKRAADVIDSDTDAEKVRKTCIDEFGEGVETTGMIVDSLKVCVDIPRLANLYRLEGSCQSESLSDALEPILITDEMREEAATVGIPLKLKATYDQSKFDKLELYFLNRDGGGIQPMDVQDGDIEEASATELQNEEIDDDTQRTVQDETNDRTDIASVGGNDDTESWSSEKKNLVNVISRLKAKGEILENELKGAKLGNIVLQKQCKPKTMKQEDEIKATMSTQHSDLMKEREHGTEMAGPSQSWRREEQQQQSSLSAVIESMLLEAERMEGPSHTDIKRKLPSRVKKGGADQSKRPKMSKERKTAIPELKWMTERRRWTMGPPGPFSIEAIPERKPMTKRRRRTTSAPGALSIEEYRLSRTLSSPQHGQPFKGTKGLAFIGNLLAVCDSDNSMVQIVNQDYVCESVLGTFDGQFKKPFRPVNVAVSKHKHYFIIDEGNLQIVVCDETRKIIKLIDLPGAYSPTGIALQNGFILVTDQNGVKLMKLTIDGKCVGQYKEGFPHSVAVNSNDVILVTDNVTSCIKCFDSSLNILHQYCTPGNEDGQILYPRGIDVDEQNNVFICDWNNHRIVKFKPGGEWQCTLFQARWPEYIAVAGDGRIAVSCDTAANSIDIYVPSE